MRSFVIVPALALALAGCAASSKSTYNAADVGRMIETAEGKVVSSRIVKINEEPKGGGTLAGAAVGATGAGLGIGSGKGSVLAAVIGGLVGAGAGYLAEQQLRTREGIEYMVRTEDGRTRTLVQNREREEEPIPPGTPVLIQYAGSYTRIIEKAPGDEDRWQDPDAAAADPGAKPAGGVVVVPTNPPAAAGGWTPPPGEPARPSTIRPRQQ
jgi:outer membrane lipoprotein SlyB